MSIENIVTEIKLQDENRLKLFVSDFIKSVGDEKLKPTDKEIIKAQAILMKKYQSK